MVVDNVPLLTRGWDHHYLLLQYKCRRIFDLQTMAPKKLNEQFSYNCFLWSDLSQQDSAPYDWLFFFCLFTLISYGDDWQQQLHCVWFILQIPMALFPHIWYNLPDFDPDFDPMHSFVFYCGLENIDILIFGTSFFAEVVYTFYWLCLLSLFTFTMWSIHFCTGIFFSSLFWLLHFVSTRFFLLSIYSGAFSPTLSLTSSFSSDHLSDKDE